MAHSRIGTHDLFWRTVERGSTQSNKEELIANQLWQKCKQMLKEGTNKTVRNKSKNHKTCLTRKIWQEIEKRREINYIC